MERKFVIVTDSSADLPEVYYKEHQVECVPLGFLIDSVTYGGDHGEKMDVTEFYAKLREGAMPTTFQVSPDQARSHVEPLLQAGNDVLIVAFSSGLSGTASSFTVSARELAEKYPERKIVVVDSLCASLGQGLFIDYIVKKADTGATIEEVRDYAEDLKLHICHMFTVENLFHLKRGGRVSATTAIVGSLLKIKPVMHMDNEGHLVAIGKTVGRKKSIAALVEHMKQLQIMENGEPIFISHGDCMEDVEYLVGLLKENFGEREILINHVGTVIGTHSGAGTVALFFRGKNR